MMGKSKDATEATPKSTPTLKKQNSSGPQSGQRSIASFFTKAPTNGTPSSSSGALKENASKAANAMAKPALPPKRPAFKKASVKSMTPVPSSDAMGPSSSQENENGGIQEEVGNGLPSPTTPAKRVAQHAVNGNSLGSSPSRKVCILFYILTSYLTLPRPRKLSATPNLRTMMMRTPSTLLVYRNKDKGHESL